MTYNAAERDRIIQAAREDGWKRGCTCGYAPSAAILSEGPPLVKVGIEHLPECPLWNPRDLRWLPPDTPPDSLTTVDLAEAES
jgi:hypothetical protein